MVLVKNLRNFLLNENKNRSLCHQRRQLLSLLTGSPPHFHEQVREVGILTYFLASFIDCGNIFVPNGDIVFHVYLTFFHFEIHRPWLGSTKK